MAQVPAQFAADFDLWADDLIRQGIDTPEGVAEIRETIREAFAAGGEHAEYWQRRVAEEAAFIRRLHAQGAGIAERLKPRNALAA